MTSALLFLLYGCLSVAVAAWLVSTGTAVPFGAMGGAMIFLVAAQLHGGLAAARTRRRLAKELEAIRTENATAWTNLNETRKRMDDVVSGLAQRSDAQEKKVVGELQMIESLIRDFTSGIARKTREALPAAEETRRMPAAVPGMIEIIRRSLEDNRIDLYLQPVVSLPQRKVRFYEALSRLRSEDGTVIMPAQYIKVAAPAGLMSVVDNLLLFRCVQVVRRLTHKRRDIGVFCNISGNTLADAEFFPQFATFLEQHRDLAGQIIFEFTQESVLGGGVVEEASFRRLAALGFQLSMDQVTTLDLDFAGVRELGFRFIKVKAATLLSGMRDAHSAVAAEDLKALLARNGLDLIVERIEDEKTVVQLLDYDVDFGQGYLFGEPRPIRDVAEANDPRAAGPASIGVLPRVLVRRLAS